MDYDASIQRLQEVQKQLEDTLVVMAAIQERQARVQREQAEELDTLRARERAHDKWLANFEEKMSEIEDKLNGLIGYLDDQRHPPA
jgi:septal ring factor EnvC (AmiA/AmiB activator)